MSDTPVRMPGDEHLEEINRAFRKLIGLLARPAGGDLFQRGIEAVAMLLRASYGGVVLAGPHGRLKEGVFTRLVPWGKRDVRRFIEHRRPLVERVISHKQEFRVANVAAYLRDTGSPIRYPTLTSFLGVPIADEERVYGCVYLCDKVSGEEFGDDDALVVSSFAQTLAFVLAQAHGREERKRVLREREVLAQLGKQLSMASTPEQAAEIIVETADKLIGWDACSVALYSPRQGLVHVLLNKDLIEGRRVSVPPFYLARPPGEVMRRTLEHGAQLVLREEGKTLPLGLEAFGDKTRQSQSLMFAPLRTGGPVSGVLTIQSYSPRAYSQRDLKTLQALADHCAGALERTRVEKALREQVNGLQLLRLFYERTQEPWNMPTLVQCLHELCPKYLDVHRIHILLYDKKRDVLVSDQLIRVAYPEEEVALGPQPVGYSISGMSFALGRPIVIGDCEKSDLIPREYVEALGLKSTVAVPIRGRKSLLGVMRIDDTKRLYRFSDEDVELLSMLAEQIGVLLENARRFRKRRSAREE